MWESDALRAESAGPGRLEDSTSEPPASRAGKINARNDCRCEHSPGRSQTGRLRLFVNRLILRDQELILAALSEYEEDAAYHKRNAQIFEKGYVREYPEAFAVLRPEIPNSRCEELYDILDMFGVLRASYEDLPEDEKAEVDERDISPQGFDYNNMEEGRLAGYVKHLLADKRYEELAEPLRKYSDGGNSHGPRLEMYRRMLHCFRPLWRKHMLGDRFLGLAEIEKVIAAQRYDSGY